MFNSELSRRGKEDMSPHVIIRNTCCSTLHNMFLVSKISDRSSRSNKTHRTSPILDEGAVQMCPDRNGGKYQRFLVDFTVKMIPQYCNTHPVLHIRLRN